MEQHPGITTDRLLLRPHNVGDLDEQFSLYRDPLVGEFIRGLPASREDAWHRLQRYAGHWSLLGYGMFAVFERGSGSMIGEVGLADFQRGLGADFDVSPEAAWLFAGKAQGLGYGREAMRALFNWFDTVRPEGRTVCIIDAGNSASIRLAACFNFQGYECAKYRGAIVTKYQRFKR
ncbi:GNAT family N-acetyltransferase [Sphingobium sp. V4]|uniref:GNAT family N-acetyltransferase n=1 Tax=Sphingobium sp. V4 TaxID=3038927 RepID=UPI00333C6637